MVASPTFVASTLTLAAHLQPLVIFGVSTGLRSDVLLAGFVGSVVAMVLLNTVPGQEPGWAGFVASSARRLAVAATSCLTAGYLVAGIGGFDGLGPTLFFAFVIGAGAQTILPRAIASIRFVNSGGENKEAS